MGSILFVALAGFAFALLEVASAQKMFIVEAGVQGKTGPDVEDELVFCPTQFSSKGISIQCTVPTAPITYTVNNNVIHVENNSPFTISGDGGGYFFPWTDYPTDGAPFLISCKNNQGYEVAKTITFACYNPQVSDPVLIGSGVFRNVEGITGGDFLRHEPCTTAVAGKVYLIGGRFGKKAVYVFDPTTKTWSKLGYTKREVHHHQCAVLDDRYIYIGSSWSGSWPDEIAHDVLFVYDTVTGKWTEEPGLGARARGAGAAAFYKGKLYVAMGNRGGHRKGSLSVGEFDMYDPQTKKWTSLPSAPDARDHTRGAIIGDSFCVGGGRLSGADDSWHAAVAPLNCYSFLTNSWEQKASLPSPRAGVMVAATCQGLLMIAGGEGSGPNGPQAFARVDFYDLTTNTFKEPGFMTQARHGTGAGVMDCSCGNIYITHGSGGKGASLELSTTQAWSQDGVVRNC